MGQGQPTVTPVNHPGKMAAQLDREVPLSAQNGQSCACGTRSRAPPMLKR